MSCRAIAPYLHRPDSHCAIIFFYTELNHERITDQLPQTFADMTSLGRRILDEYVINSVGRTTN